MRLLITFLMLLFLPLSMPAAQASPQTTEKSTQLKVKPRDAGEEHRRKRRASASPVSKAAAKPARAAEARRAQAAAKKKSAPAPRRKTRRTAEGPRAPTPAALKGAKTTLSKLALTRKSGGLRGKKNRRRDRDDPAARNAPIRMSAAHHARYQKARQTAMNKLMGQLGKPYLWGGASPSTGFDCSGLVWYAYKDLLKNRIPRTANEMFQYREASPVRREKLERGDLVFFRINGRGAADHVGVYLGQGKFIQSPRTGKDIQISQLADTYWHKHYVGARRIMTPDNIRLVQQTGGTEPPRRWVSAARR
ncbi:C40 family peptidase [Pantoea sp. 1.19]|uniref:C40 family peptidase n=1 Tax=Pantoea sp. 1.19 TaxID=1925589 RepID=UPI0009FB3A0A|nr:C40 family peptidase [Pantoea sp. 1.19]